MNRVKPSPSIQPALVPTSYPCDRSTDPSPVHAGHRPIAGHATHCTSLGSQHAPATPRPIVILRLPQFSKRVGLQRSAIYARMSPKSKYWDPLFPLPIALSTSAGSNSCHLRRRTAVGWIESEVDAFLAQLSSERAGPSN